MAAAFQQNTHFPVTAALPLATLQVYYMNSSGHTDNKEVRRRLPSFHLPHKHHDHDDAASSEDHPGKEPSRTKTIVHKIKRTFSRKWKKEASSSSRPTSILWHHSQEHPLSDATADEMALDTAALSLSANPTSALQVPSSGPAVIAAEEATSKATGSPAVEHRDRLAIVINDLSPASPATNHIELEESVDVSEPIFKANDQPNESKAVAVPNRSNSNSSSSSGAPLQALPSPSPESTTVPVLNEFESEVRNRPLTIAAAEASSLPITVYDSNDDTAAEEGSLPHNASIHDSSEPILETTTPEQAPYLPFRISSEGEMPTLLRPPSVHTDVEVESLPPPGSFTTTAPSTLHGSTPAAEPPAAAAAAAATATVTRPSVKFFLRGDNNKAEKTQDENDAVSEASSSIEGEYFSAAERVEKDGHLPSVIHPRRKAFLESVADVVSPQPEDVVPICKPIVVAVASLGVVAMVVPVVARIFRH